MRRGFEFAAAHPEEAATLLLEAAREQHGMELDAELVHASQKELASACVPKQSPRSTDEKTPHPTDKSAPPRYGVGRYLDAEGKWGRMTKARWAEYLDWLSEADLLTTFVQSRAPTPGLSASLDDLRAGNAGEPIPRESIQATQLYASLFD